MFVRGCCHRLLESTGRHVERRVLRVDLVRVWFVTGLTIRERRAWRICGRRLVGAVIH